MVFVISIVIFHSLQIGKIIIYCSQHKVLLNTQQKASQTPEFQDLNLDSLQNMMMTISWMYLILLNMIGNLVVTVSLENVFLDFILMVKRQTAIGTVQQYLPPGGDDEALFHIVHDDGDNEDLDGYECFAAMEQYRKNFSPLNLNSAFARHFESKVVTINRLMKFSRAVLLQLSLYLDMEVVGRINSEGFVKKYFKIHGV